MVFSIPVVAWIARIMTSVRKLSECLPEDLILADSVAAVRPRIALISPVRDEESYVEDMIMSVAGQELRPMQWVIVDDGSSDNTASIIERYARELNFITLVQLPVRRDRKPGGEAAVGHALRKLNLEQFDYLARFDADLLLEKDYFVRIVAEFAKNPRLGIAGGGLHIKQGDGLKLEAVPDYHVRGALKMYRRECFEQLGGLYSGIGWDTIDEIYAWIYGWETRSFFECSVIHRRPTGSGIAEARIHHARGKAEYVTWSHPLFVVAKALKLAASSPSKSYWYLRGFFNSYLSATERLQDPVFKKTRRTQQIQRVVAALRTWRHRRAVSPPQGQCC